MMYNLLKAVDTLPALPPGSTPEQARDFAFLQAQIVYKTFIQCPPIEHPGEITLVMKYLTNLLRMSQRTPSDLAIERPNSEKVVDSMLKSSQIMRINYVAGRVLWLEDFLGTHFDLNSFQSSLELSRSYILHENAKSKNPISQWVTSIETAIDQIVKKACGPNEGSYGVDVDEQTKDSSTYLSVLVALVNLPFELIKKFNSADEGTKVAVSERGIGHSRGAGSNRSPNLSV